jgi:hypothetical protein
MDESVPAIAKPARDGEAPASGWREAALAVADERSVFVARSPYRTRLVLAAGVALAALASLWLLALLAGALGLGRLPVVPLPHVGRLGDANSTPPRRSTAPRKPSDRPKRVGSPIRADSEPGARAAPRSRKTAPSVRGRNRGRPGTQAPPAPANSSAPSGAAGPLLGLSASGHSKRSQAQAHAPGQTRSGKSVPVGGTTTKWIDAPPGKGQHVAQGQKVR